MTVTRHRIAALLAVEHRETGTALYRSNWGQAPGAPPDGWTATAPATVATVKSGAGFTVVPDITYTAAGGDLRRTMPVPVNTYYRTTISVQLRSGTVPATVRLMAADVGTVIATIALTSLNTTGAAVLDAYTGGPAGSRGLVRIELWNAANTARQAGKVRLLDAGVWALTASSWLELHPQEARVTLDESWSPYAQAELVCPLPDQTALSDLDPRTVRRVTLTLTQSGATAKLVSYATTLWAGRLVSYLTSSLAGRKVTYLTDLFGDPLNETARPDLAWTRTMDLHLRARAVDYLAGTVTLDLTSDEALAQDFGRINTTEVALIPPATTDLRTLVDWGLNLIGGSLDAASVTAVVDPADADWTQGVSVWAFLDPFVAAAGLRLRCDETRVWHLEAPPTGTAGTVVVGAVTALDDTLTREGWGDSVVLANEWTDPVTDNDTTTYAAATTVLGAVNYTRTVLVTKTAKAKATATAAAALLARITTRGRVVTVRAVNDYRVTPGQLVQVDTPVTVIAPVLVSAVQWSWPDDEMTITTRDVPV